MPRHSVGERSRTAISMKICLETDPVEAETSASLWRSTNAGGPGLAIRFMGQGDEAARARTCTAVLVPL